MATFSITCPRVSEEQDRKEWQEMSESERREIESDLYGVARGDAGDSSNGTSVSSLPSCSSLSQESSHSLSPVLLEEQQNIEAALEEMQLYINVSIGLSEKAAYSIVQEKNPALLQRETPLINFLRAERYNIWQAASRLVSYWQHRADNFGWDNLHLPMSAANVSSGGSESCRTSALSPDALDLIRKGMILPCSNETDFHGRGIIYIDRSKLQLNAEFRVAFVRTNCQ